MRKGDDHCNNTPTEAFSPASVRNLKEKIVSKFTIKCVPPEKT